MSIRTLSGLAVLALGLCAAAFVKGNYRSIPLSWRWRLAHVCALVVGVPLGIALLAHSSYPNPNSRLLGFPFFAAEFQHAASGGWVDFVGAVTLIATIGNFTVGFLIPQIFFAGILWLRIHSTRLPASTAVQ